MPIIAPIPRTERRLMQKTIHKTKDKNHIRRLTAMLMLHRVTPSAMLPAQLCCTSHRLVAGLTGSRCLAQKA